MEKNYTFKREKPVKDERSDQIVANKLTKPMEIKVTNVETPTTDIPTTGTNITLVREAFDKDKFKETVNTEFTQLGVVEPCLLYTSPSPRDRQKSRMPSSA